MISPIASDVKIFVPAMDFSQSIGFYEPWDGPSTGGLRTIA